MENSSTGRSQLTSQRLLGYDSSDEDPSNASLKNANKGHGKWILIITKSSIDLSRYIAYILFQVPV